MPSYKPSSLLLLAIKRLLRDENLAISSLRSLPTELFPRLFLEAYTHKCWKTVKALVQSWPFDRLPLGPLVYDLFPDNENLKSVLDGIDVLLQQEVLPRCQLKVLDLQPTGEKFWSVWTGDYFPVCSLRKQLEAEGPTRNKNARPCLEVCVDLYLNGRHRNNLFLYLLNWIKKRKGVRLCCKTVTIHSLSRKNVKLLRTISFPDVQELQVNCTWTISDLQTFGKLLSRMKNLRRLCLEITTLEGIPSNELENQNHLISEFTSKFLQLLRLQELYLESVSFLQGHLDQLLRNLQNQLEVISVTNCTLTEGDLTHLFQSPHIHQLKELCLRGVPVTFVSEPLRALLEVNAATLQDLDLSLCGLQDPQLEALLPALSSCSQLSSLNLHGNRLSMATLEKLLRCTSGLQHLCLQLFPAPMESFSSHGILQSGTFDLLCTQISKILQDLRYSRSIMVSCCHCSYCAQKVFKHWEPMFIPCFSCLHHYEKLSFRIIGCDI